MTALRNVGSVLGIGALAILVAVLIGYFAWPLVVILFGLLGYLMWRNY